jgi:outer membrane scaffolding protein for murein synthesis (MipA/OmpV family)
MAAQPWFAELGPGIAVFPKYPGARAEAVWPIPSAEVRYSDSFFFNTRTGLGVTWHNDPQWQMGASFWFRKGRSHNDGPAVAELADIKTAGKAQLFLASHCGPIWFDGTASQDIGGSKGFTLDMSTSWRFSPTPRLHGSLGIEASLANRKFMQTWFGITPEQSATSGLQQYSAGGGLKSAGPTASLRYALTDRWSINTAVMYDVLLVKAADSPVVERRTLPAFTVGVAYRFAP